MNEPMSAKQIVSRLKKYGRVVLNADELRDSMLPMCIAAGEDAHLQCRIVGSADLVEVVWVSE